LGDGSFWEHRGDGAIDTASDWVTKPLPIMKSLSKGFHPVYVYSKVAPPDESMKFSQERQDEVILALTKMNDKVQDLKSTRRPFFVDLSANDALTLSNTFLLEKRGEFARPD
jgi:hypothetical protein